MTSDPKTSVAVLTGIVLLKDDFKRKVTMMFKIQNNYRPLSLNELFRWKNLTYNRGFVWWTSKACPFSSYAVQNLIKSQFSNWWHLVMLWCMSVTIGPLTKFGLLLPLARFVLCLAKLCRSCLIRDNGLLRGRITLISSFARRWKLKGKHF